MTSKIPTGPVDPTPLPPRQSKEPRQGLQSISDLVMQVFAKHKQRELDNQPHPPESQERPQNAKLQRFD